MQNQILEGKKEFMCVAGLKIDGAVWEEGYGQGCVGRIRTGLCRKDADGAVWEGYGWTQEDTEVS